MPSVTSKESIAVRVLAQDICDMLPERAPVMHTQFAGGGHRYPHLRSALPDCSFANIERKAGI